MRKAVRQNSFYVSFFVLLASCSLWGPLRKDEGAKNYQIDSSLKGWKTQTKWEEADYLYVNQKSSAHITVTSVCDRYEIASLRSLMKSALSPLKERSVIKEEQRMLDSREALTHRVSGKLDGVLVETIVTVLRKGDCIFDFYLTSFKSVSEEEENAYEKLLKSFHYKGY